MDFVLFEERIKNRLTIFEETGESNDQILVNIFSLNSFDERKELYLID